MIKYLLLSIIIFSVIIGSINYENLSEKYIYKSGNLQGIEIEHSGAGFFSCCTVILNYIVNYNNINNKLPEIINTEKVFGLYNPYNRDIRSDFFNENNDIINNNVKCFQINYHNSDYNKLDFANINKYINRYFNLSNKIQQIITKLESKYNFNYENLCSIYYRGTDKISEVDIPSYDKYIIEIDKIISVNPNIEILIQTDETHFINLIKNKYKRSRYKIISENITSNTKMGIHYKNNKIDNYNQISNLLATVKIMSKSKYILFHCSNVSLWITLYRGNTNGIINYYDGKFNYNISDNII